jgi:hypothetical protein
MIKGQSGSQVNIQDYLQEAFLCAVEKLNAAVGDLDSVLGIEVCPKLRCPMELTVQLINEPHPGFIGLPTVQEWV